MVGTTVMILVRNCLVKNVVWDGTLSWCNSRSFRRQTSGNNISHMFAQSPSYITVVCRIDCSACQDEFSVNNLLGVKQYDEYALGFALHLSHFFRSRWVWTFPLGGLLLFLRVITVKPALATIENPGQEGSIVGSDLTTILADFARCCFWSAVRILSDQTHDSK
jgi:hypothetical protein